jgi:spermidine synthase
LKAVPRLSPDRARARDAGAGTLGLALMVASGFAGLGYQIVWTQQCAVWLGHEAAAVLAVVAAFFGGVSLGALWLGRRIEKSAHPVRWYAGCELVIAGWGLILALALPLLGGGLLRVMGARPSPAWQWTAAFCGTFVLLLPATAAMGATLPAMARVNARSHGERVAALYASNTFGAVAGLLVVTFWLVPRIGFVRSALSCATLNLLCAVAAVFAFTGRSAAAASAPPGRSGRGALLRLAITGSLGIGYEVLVVRVLSQVAEDTVYTFALLLAVYLVGSALGAAAYQRWLRVRRDQDAPGDGERGRPVAEERDLLLAALALACLCGTASLWHADWLNAQAKALLGRSANAAIVAEGLPALCAFAAPTLVMGALFSHLASRAQAAGVGFGRALGVNTLGAAAAPALFGVLILPALGPKTGLLLVALGYLPLMSRSAWSKPIAWLPAAAALVLAFSTPRLAFVEVPDGGRLVSYEDGAVAAVSVIEDAGGTLSLRIDNRAQEGSNRTQRVDGRQAWLPLLLHPAPRRALFLGLGTGVTAASAAEDPTLQVDAVELLPEVIRASENFAASVADGSAFPRLKVLAGDARRYVRVSEQRYDVIVSDNFHPARSGSAALYTVEHFQAVRLRLEPTGVFCQWLPLHQLDRETLRSIVGAFLSAFPKGWAMIASGSLETPVLGLVGRRDAERFDAAALHQRLRHVALPERVNGIGLEDDLAVLGSFIAGPAALRRLADGAPVNTDDRPIVAYLAPRITYAPNTSPGDRLLGLLQELSLEPEQLISPTPDASWPSHLAAYWTARNRFLESGRRVRPSPRLEDMLAQVRDPLLSVLRISPEFRPAYDPLLLMATALARSDVEGARTLVTELVRIQPLRTEATQLLASLSPPKSTHDAAPR